MGQLGFFDADKRLQALSAGGDPPLADKVTSSEHDVIAGQQRVERERLIFQGNRAIAPTDHGILTNGGDCEQTACM